MASISAPHVASPAIRADLPSWIFNMMSPRMKASLQTRGNSTFTIMEPNRCLFISEIHWPRGSKKFHTMILLKNWSINSNWLLEGNAVSDLKTFAHMTMGDKTEPDSYYNSRMEEKKAVIGACCYISCQKHYRHDISIDLICSSLELDKKKFTKYYYHVNKKFRERFEQHYEKVNKSQSSPLPSPSKLTKEERDEIESGKVSSLIESIIHEFKFYDYSEKGARHQDIKLLTTLSHDLYLMMNTIYPKISFRRDVMTSITFHAFKHFKGDSHSDYNFGHHCHIKGKLGKEQ